MNEVLQTALDYMQTPQTGYAFLITGPWGCGKTHFWRNVIEPKLKEARCGGAAWRPLYASPYGCQSTKDRDTQLFLASNPSFRKKWISRLSAIGGNALQQIVKAFTPFERPSIELRWLVNGKEALLCFVDLPVHAALKDAMKGHCEASGKIGQSKRMSDSILQCIVSAPNQAIRRLNQAAGA
ncbi:MAG: P-loop NTPase fold protein, partial [Planctomycetota bacterium]